MKVYVDENDIKRNIITYCNGTNTQQGLYVYGKDKIEVLSLADYTKQVRKEVCEKIREICKLNIRTYKIQSQDDCERYKEIDAFNKAIFGVLEILDQIEQGKQND